MLDLAYSYGWTLDYIRSLTVREIDIAFDYSQRKQKQSQGGEMK